MIKTCSLVFLLIMTLALTACQPWVIRPINDPNSTQGQSSVPGKPGFSAMAYIDSLWSSQVLTTVQEKATDLPTLLAAIKQDATAAGQKYGHREGERPYNFLVKGEAKVLEVDTSLRSGTAKIDLLPGDGQPDATIQLGPVIRGTSLRDALPFIQFNEFTNQIEYADVSNQLNNKVVKDVLSKVDLAGLQGKTVVFEGAFTSSANSNVLITPVKLQMK